MSLDSEMNFLYVGGFSLLDTYTLNGFVNSIDPDSKSSYDNERIIKNALILVHTGFDELSRISTTLNNINSNFSITQSKFDALQDEIESLREDNLILKKKLSKLEMKILYDE